MRGGSAELVALATHLADRRSSILRAWREAVTRDPALRSGAALPRVQLHDHIPGVLDAFERSLRTNGDDDCAEAEQPEAEGAAHGLHRWQQGYDLGEVTRELGKLNECMVRELDDYAARQPGADRQTMATARLRWAELCSVAVSGSTSKYFQLRQIEAAGHIQDLEAALQSLRELELQRAALWQEAAHDLRGNLGGVVNATAGLVRTGAAEPYRADFLDLLQRNVASLHRLLDDVTGLARLQAGQEQRRIERIDAATLLRELCEELQPHAEQRGLRLRFEGAPELVVDADAVKTRRIAQNLIVNAIKYTREGGVTVTWGDSAADDDKRWMFSVADTGPGFHAGPGAQLAGALGDASDQARDASGAAADEASHADKTVTKVPVRDDPRPVSQQHGEGIGLSIVKRLCELLDASVEMESAPEVGTVLRILLPRHYPD